MNVRFFIKQCTKYKNIFRNFGINVWVCKLVTIINKLTDSAANFGLGITALFFENKWLLKLYRIGSHITLATPLCKAAHLSIFSS